MAQALNFDDIKDSCTSLTNLASSIGGTVEAIEAAIAKIANPAWEGKAATAYRDKYETSTRRIDDMRNAIKYLLKNALTDKIDDREMFMKGIDYSYYYEEP